MKDWENMNKVLFLRGRGIALFIGCAVNALNDRTNNKRNGALFAFHAEINAGRLYKSGSFNSDSLLKSMTHSTEIGAENRRQTTSADFRYVCHHADSFLSTVPRTCSVWHQTNSANG